MTTLAEIKRRVQPGQVYDVTNHFITRADHPSFGTTRRVVTRLTSARIYMKMHGPDSIGVDALPTVAAVKTAARQEREIDWPPASQVRMDDDGTIRLYGGGIGQKRDELFLTLWPVTA